jgi:hypothetical protein
MAKRSEIEQKIAQLQADLESADTDDEIWIKDDSGREIKVTGKKATTVLDRFADLWKAEDPGDGTDGADTGTDGADTDPGPQRGYFGRKAK